MAFFTRQGRAKSIRDLSRPSFMDRKSGMRQEGTPASLQASAFVPDAALPPASLQARPRKA